MFNSFDLYGSAREMFALQNGANQIRFQIKVPAKNSPAREGMVISENKARIPNGKKPGIL